jgi:hypothetical protein
MRFNCGEVRCACRRGDLIFSVDSSREYARDVAPESPVWKERGRGRLRMLDRAQKACGRCGRLRRSRAAIVCTMLDWTKTAREKAYTCPMNVSNIAPVHGVCFQHIQQ